MTVYDDILAELRAMRVTLDKIAARVVSDQTREELMPVWVCGHRHASRGEALLCEKQSDNLRPVNADAAAYD